MLLDPIPAPIYPVRYPVEGCCQAENPSEDHDLRFLPFRRRARFCGFIRCHIGLSRGDINNLVGTIPLRPDASRTLVIGDNLEKTALFPPSQLPESGSRPDSAIPCLPESRGGEAGPVRLVWDWVGALTPPRGRSPRCYET